MVVNIKRHVFVPLWIALVVAFATSAAAAPSSEAPVAEEGYAHDASDLTSLLGLHDTGTELSLWGWGYYAAGSEDDYSDTWGGELELDATQTFANRVSVAADIEFVDYDDEKWGDLEQAFVSVLVSPDIGMLLTVGKFNTPFGVEARDYWDRYTATPSLLFRAQPQDMRAVMLTVPLRDTGLYVRPFAATGFHDEGHIAGDPSVGMTVEYRPTEKFTFAVTNWFGPGLSRSASADSGGGDGGGDDGSHVYGGDYDHDYGDHDYDDYDDHDYGDHDYDDEDDEDYEEHDYEEYGNYGDDYGSSALHLTEAWNGADFDSAERGRLYFLDVQATWKVRRDFLLAGEFLFGRSKVDSTDYWHGVLVLANYDFNDQWRAFAHWSYLDDTDGVVTGLEQRRQAVGVGAGYRVNRYVEFRTEYRHDYSDEAEDVDSVSFHASFGY